MVGPWLSPQEAHQGTNLSSKKEIGGRSRERKEQECLPPGETWKCPGSRKKGRKQMGASGHHGRNIGGGGRVDEKQLRCGSQPSGDSQAQSPANTEGPELCPVAQGVSETRGSGRGRGNPVPIHAIGKLPPGALFPASTALGPGHRSWHQPWPLD